MKPAHSNMQEVATATVAPAGIAKGRLGLIRRVGKAYWGFELASDKSRPVTSYLSSSYLFL